MNAEMGRDSGRIERTSEAMKTAPDGGGTPDPEPHHLALTETTKPQEQQDD